MVAALDLPHAELAARYSAGVLVATLAADYDCDPKTIRKSLRNSGVYRTRYYTPEEKQALVASYCAGETIQTLAAAQGVSYATMSENLKNWGVDFRRTGPGRTHTLQETFFDVIDTEEKAYWLGFLYADGNVRHNVVQLDLAICDRAHVQAFANAVGYSGALLEQTRSKDDKEHRSAYVHIGCAYMCRALTALGCVPRKTYAAQLLTPAMPTELYSHFYRGYFDGDGCLSKHSTKPAHAIELIGHPDFIATAQQWLMRTCDLAETALITPKNCATPVRVVRYQGNRQVKRILDALYADATIYLTRKYQQYQRFCESYAH